MTFVARGAHLAALQERGLEVRTQGQTIRIQPVTAVAQPAGAAGPGGGRGAGPQAGWPGGGRSWRA